MVLGEKHGTNYLPCTLLLPLLTSPTLLFLAIKKASIAICSCFDAFLYLHIQLKKVYKH